MCVAPRDGCVAADPVYSTTGDGQCCQANQCEYVCDDDDGSMDWRVVLAVTATIIVVALLVCMVALAIIKKRASGKTRVQPTDYVNQGTQADLMSAEQIDTCTQPLPAYGVKGADTGMGMPLKGTYSVRKGYDNDNYGHPYQPHQGAVQAATPMGTQTYDLNNSTVSTEHWSEDGSNYGASPVSVPPSYGRNGKRPAQSPWGVPPDAMPQMDSDNGSPAYHGSPATMPHMATGPGVGTPGRTRPNTYERGPHLSSNGRTLPPVSTPHRMALQNAAKQNGSPGQSTA